MTDAEFYRARYDAVIAFMDNVADGSNPNDAWERLCLLFGRYTAPWLDVAFVDEGPKRVGVER